MKFLCDNTVGRLAKWLRLLGYDTIYLKTLNPYEIVKTAQKEERIILTRNRRIKKMTRRVFFIKTDFLFEQLKEVVKRFPISRDRFFTRCSKDNAILKPINKEKIKGKVPYYTYHHFEEFYQCPECKRIYWKGSHYNLIVERLKKEGIWELLS